MEIKEKLLNAIIMTGDLTKKETVSFGQLNGNMLFNDIMIMEALVEILNKLEKKE